MAIFNTNPDAPNPDAPVLDGRGFIQHTCQAPQVIAAQQQQYYYNGMSSQPVMPQQSGVGYNMPAQTDSRRYDAPPTPAPVSPWAQQQQQPTFGFNQMVEDSRRNLMTPPQQQPASPWVVQPVPQSIPTPQPQYVYASQYDPRYSALYTCHPSFDKKSGAWGNTDVTQPCVPPTVNWNAQPAPTAVAQTPQGYVSITYPITNQPFQTDWLDLVNRNIQMK